MIIKSEEFCRLSAEWIDEIVKHSEHEEFGVYMSSLVTEISSLLDTGIEDRCRQYQYPAPNPHDLHEMIVRHMKGLMSDLCEYIA